MEPEFNQGRLHVGYRANGWYKVYYERDEDEDEEEGTPMKFKFTTLTRGDTTPLHAEICWLPWFNWAYCEAQGKPTQCHLQTKTLVQAWKYCAEENEAIVRRMEAEYERANGKCPRFMMWFEGAKKWKAKKFKARKRRQQGNGDDNDDDSGYSDGGGGGGGPQGPSGPGDVGFGGGAGSDGDGGMRQRARPPPPTPRSIPNGTSKKRKSNTDGPQPVHKKQQLGHRYDAAVSNRPASPSDLFMSSGARSESVNGDHSDESDPEIDMDTRDPNLETTPTPANPHRPTWDFNNLDLNNGPRTKGRSVRTSSLSNFGGSQKSNQAASYGQANGVNDNVSRSIEDDRDEDARRRAEEVNGEGMDEQAAIDRATRESMSVVPPDNTRTDDYMENFNGMGVSDEDALERAQQASMSEAPPDNADDDDAAKNEEMEDD